MSENEQPKKPAGANISTGFPKPRYDQKARNLGIISSDADGILTRMFRNICYDLTDNQYFSKMAWRRMMEKYLDELLEQDPSVNRQNERGNFGKALAAPKMSWKTYIKSLRMLRFTKIRFIIIGTRDDGVISMHSMTAGLKKDKSGNDADVDAVINVIEEAARDAIENQNNKGKQ